MSQIERHIEGCLLLSDVLEAAATVTESTDLTELGAAAAMEGVGIKLIGAAANTAPTPIVSVPLGIVGTIFLVGGVVGGTFWTTKQAAKVLGGPKVPSLLSGIEQSAVKQVNKKIDPLPKSAGMPIGRGITPRLPSGDTYLAAKNHLDNACEWLKRKAEQAAAAKAVPLPGVDFKFPVRIDSDHSTNRNLLLRPSATEDNGSSGGEEHRPGDRPGDH